MQLLFLLHFSAIISGISFSTLTTLLKLCQFKRQQRSPHLLLYAAARCCGLEGFPFANPCGAQGEVTS